MEATQRYISDPHLGHEAMAIKRGFPNSYYHDENFIYQWNNVVSKHDTTWILGDITMEKRQYDILDRLKGIKRVIMGNHDMGNHAHTLLEHVNSIHGMVKLRHKKYSNIWLTHCPVHPQELEYRVKLNIHGHVHENTLKDKRYINVSAEVINYIPQTLEQLINND